MVGPRSAAGRHCERYSYSPRLSQIETQKKNQTEVHLMLKQVEHIRKFDILVRISLLSNC
ncbi:hypothetical protein Tco_1477616, partial [Tanacetum coccineum]